MVGGLMEMAAGVWVRAVGGHGVGRRPPEGCRGVTERRPELTVGWPTGNSEWKLEGCYLFIYFAEWPGYKGGEVEEAVEGKEAQHQEDLWCKEGKGIHHSRGTLVKFSQVFLPRLEMLLSKSKVQNFLVVSELVNSSTLVLCMM
ncbi:hypothetical protein ACSBR1_021671 [Camellia fascicularis]